MIGTDRVGRSTAYSILQERLAEELSLADIAPDLHGPSSRLGMTIGSNFFNELIEQEKTRIREAAKAIYVTYNTSLKAVEGRTPLTYAIDAWHMKRKC